MDVFARYAVPYLLGPGGNEGEHSDDPADRGGETFFGIASVHHPEILDCKTVGEQRACAVRIYREEYWDRFNLSAVAEIYPELAVKVFDFGVNPSGRIACNRLQQSLNMLRAGYPRRPLGPIKVDSDVGPNTIAAIREEMRRHPAENFRDRVAPLMAAMCGHQFAWYWRVATDKGHADADARFGGGWVVRAWRVPKL